MYQPLQAWLRKECQSDPSICATEASARFFSDPERQKSPLFPLAVWLAVQPETSVEPERVHSDVTNTLTDKRQLGDIALNTIVRIQRKGVHV